jgi:hypothetical protein
LDCSAIEEEEEEERGGGEQEQEELNISRDVATIF